MDSRLLYGLFLLTVAVSRLFELWLSRRNTQRLAGQGARQASDPVYPLMVLLHAGVLAGSAAEVWMARRPWIPALAAACLLIWAAANALRFWCIRTLGRHWNTRIMDSTAAGVVISGPYRYVRHPNYVAVFLEMLAIPLLHAAWAVALVGAVCHLMVLRERIRSEERVLSRNEEWRRHLGPLPRFVPRWRSGPMW